DFHVTGVQTCALPIFPVAAIGLVVNVVSVALLHDKHDHDHDHPHHHDHNHRAALMHVVADAFTSVLAIGALLAGRYLGWVFLDQIGRASGREGVSRAP